MTQVTPRPIPPVQPPTNDGTMGLPQSTALIMGSIIGVGIFSLPVLAGRRTGRSAWSRWGWPPSARWRWRFMFAVMSRRLPADGGPYAYARAAFGNGIGFANAWSYWITAWAGNAAIVVGWVYYVEHFVNKGGAIGLVDRCIALVGLWIPAVINLTGVRNMGSFQVWTTVLKFIPLAFMSTVGLFFINAGNFTPWNVSGDTNLSAIGGAMAICLFSYLGVETAAVAAAQGPRPGPQRAQVDASTARWRARSVYLLSLIAVFGIVPDQRSWPGRQQASYSTAANTIFGGGPGPAT